MIRAYFRNFFIMNICSLITVRFSFGFQKFFIVDACTIKFFFNTVAGFIPNIIIFFNNSPSSINKFMSFNFKTTRLYNIFIHLLYLIKKIILHNESLFSLKSEFFNKFTASLLVIPRLYINNQHNEYLK